MSNKITLLVAQILEADDNDDFDARSFVRSNQWDSVLRQRGYTKLANGCWTKAIPLPDGNEATIEYWVNDDGPRVLIGVIKFGKHAGAAQFSTSIHDHEVFQKYEDALAGAQSPDDARQIIWRLWDA